MMILAIDFDGTIVKHRFPKIGDPVPGAFYWLRRFQDTGARLILWTMRSGGRSDGTDPLAEAVEYCRSNGLEFWAVNQNPGQTGWTQSPKAYAHAYIDDTAIGCPLIEDEESGQKPFVNWEVIGPMVMDMIEAKA